MSTNVGPVIRRDRLLPGVPRTCPIGTSGTGHHEGFTTFHHRDNGTYTATLTVRDQFGNEGKDTVEVTVNNLPPRGGLNGPA